jgi:hypothetical protein
VQACGRRVAGSERCRPTNGCPRCPPVASARWDGTVSETRPGRGPPSRGLPLGQSIGVDLREGGARGICGQLGACGKRARQPMRRHYRSQSGCSAESPWELVRACKAQHPPQARRPDRHRPRAVAAPRLQASRARTGGGARRHPHRLGRLVDDHPAGERALPADDRGAAQARDEDDARWRELSESVEYDEVPAWAGDVERNRSASPARVPGDRANRLRSRPPKPQAAVAGPALPGEHSAAAPPSGTGRPPRTCVPGTRYIPGVS